MTTQTLIELQRSEPLNAQFKELENYCADIGFTETAHAIALVPKLIAEVIRLRETESVLRELIEMMSRYGLVPDDSDPFYSVWSRARAALANDK